MPGTFSQIYIQIVFAVKNRDNLIQPSWEEELYKYISGIIKNKQQKLIAINGMPDHIHLFIGIKPSCCLSDLVREIKKSPTEFINEKKFSKFKFNWQEGYGAFSYEKSQVPRMIKYIQTQEEHHQERSFIDEYRVLLETFEIDYDEQFLFKPIE